MVGDPRGRRYAPAPPGTGAIIDYYHKIVRGYKKRVKQLRKSLTAKSEEVITLHRRLLQQQAEREAAYDADKSMDASLPCSPIPPQSGTVSRTSCPRRDTDEAQAAMSVKRKALIITPEKARPEDSEEESEEEEEPVEEGEAEEEEQEDEMAESEVNAESEEKREADKEQEADNEVAFEAESDVEYVQVDHVDPASEQMRSREVKFRVDVANQLEKSKQWVRYKTLPHGNCITHCLMMIEGVTEPHAFKSWETMTNEEQCAAETKADNYREQIYKEAIEMNRRATPGYRRPEEGLRDELFHEVCSVHTVTEEGNIGKPIMQEKWLTQWAVEAWCSMTGKSVAYLHVVRDFDPKIDPVVGMYVFSKSEEGKVTHVAFKPNENGQSALACFAQQCREWKIEYAVEVTRGHATLRKVPPGLKRRRWSVKK
ncbi:hypothetical protein J8273_4974 [Carpediemonas membranifera]|uniref:Uncharacterized protein n=1 Tax=Carpediemonas membranifera TaxID=201153 RepID=A0A8J6ASN8_9EUKA|nr:hypothetical protein J8273_4974 [Carpediemonas membranifera]|eukprot:KAG9393496.1 hypothetical protein J8273_4974 [Carpediemonas membranifera]